MIDPSNPTFQEFLRVWYARKRLEEGREVANALATPENIQLHTMFRNHTVNNKLLEDREILDGVEETIAPIPRPQLRPEHKETLRAKEELQIAQATLTTELQTLVEKAGDIEIL